MSFLGYEIQGVANASDGLDVGRRAGVLELSPQPHDEDLHRAALVDVLAAPDPPADLIA